MPSFAKYPLVIVQSKELTELFDTDCGKSYPTSTFQSPLASGGEERVNLRLVWGREKKAKRAPGSAQRQEAERECHVRPNQN